MQSVSFVFLLLLIFVPIVFSGRILHKIDAAAKLYRRPVKIYLVDFFSLVFMVQLPMAIIFQTGRQEQGAAIFTAGIFGVLMALVWWTTIKSVSRAGIFKVSERACFSLIVIPMTYVGSFAIIGFGLAIANRPGNQPVFGLAAIELILVGLLVFSWWFTVRTVRRRAAELGKSPAVEDSISNGH